MAAPSGAIDRLVRRFAAQPHVRRIWLFGSRARGDAAERSDIDLAVEAPEASEPEWLEMAGWIDEADTLLPIDLVRLDDASEGLRQQVRKEGRVIFERGTAP
ncbi:MAG TPA: nucleotidyltransferase domain-containing protein [Candidatus Acidoferrales bacterium]|nr:nucleotidyltransferase domain-containing protein [Candidatus Acidoferrales bacterium]